MSECLGKDTRGGGFSVKKQRFAHYRCQNWNVERESLLFDCKLWLLNDKEGSWSECRGNLGFGIEERDLETGRKLDLKPE